MDDYNPNQDFFHTTCTLNLPRCCMSTFTQVVSPTRISNSLFSKTFYITYFKQWFHSFKLVFPARNLRIIQNSSVFLKIHICKVPLKSLKFVLSFQPTLLLHHILDLFCAYQSISLSWALIPSYLEYTISLPNSLLVPSLQFLFHIATNDVSKMEIWLPFHVFLN